MNFCIVCLFISQSRNVYWPAGVLSLSERIIGYVLNYEPETLKPFGNSSYFQVTADKISQHVRRECTKWNKEIHPSGFRFPANRASSCVRVHFKMCYLKIGYLSLWLECKMTTMLFGNHREPLLYKRNTQRHLKVRL